MSSAMGAHKPLPEQPPITESPTTLLRTPAPPPFLVDPDLLGRAYYYAGVRSISRTLWTCGCCGREIEGDNPDVLLQADRSVSAGMQRIGKWAVCADCWPIVRSALESGNFPVEARQSSGVWERVGEALRSVWWRGGRR